MLKPHHFTYKCPLKISDLEQTDGGYFCAKCSKDIHDLTDCSLDEVRELQRRKGSICGFVRAVSVTSLVGLAACSKSGEEANRGAKPDDNSKPAVEQPIPVETPELMGDVCVPEEDIPSPPAQELPAGDKPVSDTGAKTTLPPERELPVEIRPIERPMIMGIICPPEQLVPEEPKQLDPDRDDSPA